MNPAHFDRALYDRASRSKARGFDRALYDQLVEERRAGGCPSSMAAVAGSKSGASLLPTPWANAACVAWFDATATQTIGAVQKSGTSPPTVSISGSQSVWIPVGIRIEITTLGANGTAQFRVSYDSGATWAHSGVTVPTTPFTYALDGAATGFTVTFANSTYATNNVYEAACTSVASLKTGTDLLTGAGTAAPRLLVGTSGILGRAAWLGDGTATNLDNAGITWPSVATKAFLYGVASPTSAGSGFGAIAGGLHATTRPQLYLSSSTVVTGFNGGNVACGGVVVGTPKRFVLAITNGVNDRVIWGSTVTLGALGGSALGALGFNLFSQNGAASTFFPGSISCCGLFSGDPADAGALTALDAWLTASSGGAGFTGGSALTS